jgi:hypothetical protein
MLFAPEVDRRVVAGVRLLPDISCSAQVLRALRRRARRHGSVTPCYESVRKLVHIERERRARALATAATVLEVMQARRILAPLDIEHIFERHLRWQRARLHVRVHTATRTTRGDGERLGKGEGRLSAALEPGSQRWIW